MAKTNKTLSNLGITGSQLRRLYIFGLTDTLHSVSGIGEKRLQKLEDDLCDQHQSERVPNVYNWVYRLTLDVMNEPLRAQNLCEIRDNDRCLLDQMRTLIQSDASKANAVLKDVLRPQEQNVLMRVYRDHFHYDVIAREFGCSRDYVGRIKSQALKKLRNSAALNALKQIIFISPKDDEADCKDGPTATT